MKFAVQINNNSCPWLPGIHGLKRKKAAQFFLNSLAKLGHRACLLRRNKNGNWEAA